MLLSPYLTQRDPALWDRPDEFDPERFAPGAEPRHRYAYFPFGGGGRQCIGNHFALMEAQLILALLLRRVQPRSLPGPAPRPSSAGTLKPKGGLRMRLQPA